jgi:hypothetical protein
VFYLDVAKVDINVTYVSCGVGDPWGFSRTHTRRRGHGWSGQQEVVGSTRRGRKNGQLIEHSFCNVSIRRRKHKRETATTLLKNHLSSHFKRMSFFVGAISLSQPFDLNTVSYESFVVRDLTLLQ